MYVLSSTLRTERERESVYVFFFPFFVQRESERVCFLLLLPRERERERESVCVFSFPFRTVCAFFFLPRERGPGKILFSPKFLSFV